jgi:hypothetical protein
VKKRQKRSRGRAAVAPPPAVYQTPGGAIALRGDLVHETVWATQAQIAKIFGISQSVVARHIKNTLQDKEISKNNIMQKMHNIRPGKPLTLYSLDLILAVGYRTNSIRAIRFRRWANDVLKRYLADGYAIDRERLERSAARVAELRESVEAIAAAGDAARTLGEARGLLAIVGRYAQTWRALERYDRGDFAADAAAEGRATGARLEPGALLADLWEVRRALSARGEATALFARERQPGALAASVGAAFQTFGGADLYPGDAAKAAHLPYLIAKDHPFVDGNKRAAVFALLSFCRAASLPAPDPVSLAALALFVAESDPARKASVVGVVASLLVRPAEN